jgi:hypothetical protein
MTDESRDVCECGQSHVLHGLLGACRGYGCGCLGFRSDRRTVPQDERLLLIKSKLLVFCGHVIGHRMMPETNGYEQYSDSTASELLKELASVEPMDKIAAQLASAIDAYLSKHGRDSDRAMDEALTEYRRATRSETKSRVAPGHRASTAGNGRDTQTLAYATNASSPESCCRAHCAGSAPSARRISLTARSATRPITTRSSMVSRAAGQPSCTQLETGPAKARHDLGLAASPT